MTTTQNALDAMTASIMGRKQAKASKLTPVGHEVAPAPAQPATVLPAKVAAPFPDDHPVETVLDAVGEIERQLAYIQRALTAIRETLAAEKPVEEEKPEAVVKAKEKAADEAFEERMARQRAEAENATFGPQDWSCPTHGQKHLTKTTSRKGRTFSTCTECGDFER